MMSILYGLRRALRVLLNKIGVTPFVLQTYRHNKPFKAQAKLIKSLKPTIFDVGAFDGRSIIEYRKIFSNCIVYSFEPTPSSFRKLKRKFGEDLGVHLFNLALASNAGQQVFFVNDSDLTNSLLAPSQDGISLYPQMKERERISVPTATIDLICERENVQCIDVLKIDVQGGEMEVLLGAKKALEKGLIKLIFLEVEFREVYHNQPLFHDISKFLLVYGYSLFAIYNLTHSFDGRLIYGDALFVRSSEE